MKKRPILFEAASIFSIIGSSVGFITMFISTLFFGFVTEKIRAVTNITATEKLTPVYFAVLTTAFCVSLAGAIKIYRMQRVGLYFYLAAQLTVLVFPAIWLGSNAFSVTNAIFTILFSGVYIYYYRILS